jgi:hypothetical protein
MKSYRTEDLLERIIPGITCITVITKAMALGQQQQ